MEFVSVTETVVSPAERMYKNHLKNVSNYQKRHKDKVKEWLEQNSDVEFLKENLGSNWFYKIMWEVSKMRKEGKLAPTNNDGVWAI